MKNKIFGMDNKVAGKYALYFAGFAIGTFVIIKLIKNLGGGPDDSTPKPVEPTPSKKVGLTAQQNKIEELQSLLGVNPDHVVGPITKGAYGKLNLGLNISLSNNTSTADLQKIIDAIVKKNKIEETSGAVKELQARAKQLYSAFRANPTSVLMNNKEVALRKVVLDKTTNRYVATGEIFIFKKGREYKREDLGVYSPVYTFKWPYYIILSDNKTNLMLANPNDWIIK
jgi:hypothetical protein